MLRQAKRLPRLKRERTQPPRYRPMPHYRLTNAPLKTNLGLSTDELRG
jgi:hypothetical protein